MLSASKRPIQVAPADDDASRFGVVRSPAWVAFRWAGSRWEACASDDDREELQRLCPSATIRTMGSGAPPGDMGASCSQTRR